MLATPNARLNLRLLEIFARVAEEGTMSAAAVRLGMSQAAVSQAVTTLEEVLSVQLFDRSVRPPALTLLGASALKHALETFAKLHEFEDAMRYGASGRVPLLRIGMLDSFTSTAGAEVVTQLRDVASEWTVTSGFKATSLASLVERRCDAIITSDDSAVPEEVDARPVLTEAFQLAVPMHYKGDVNDLKALAASLPFIRYGRDAHMARVLDSHFRRAGVLPQTRYQFDTTDAVLRMVAGGFGWTVVTPLIYLKSMVAPKTVRLVPLAGMNVTRTLLVAMRRGDSADILPRIVAAAVLALRDKVLPQIDRLLPDCGRSGAFVIAKDGKPAARKTPGPKAAGKPPR